MAGWKDLLIDVLKLTDEKKRLSKDIDKLQSHVVDVDRRVVRLETLVEVAKYHTQIANDTK
jgi:3D (Asp-Asp-Asp) domain-containing protein